MNQPLTVVLPMYNRERQLRSSILDILDLALAMHRSIQIVVVDDGSTDDTYEAACELARTYPQVIVLRQSIRQGISAALELVRNRLALEMVMVHDGISAIDVAQLQSLLQAGTDRETVSRSPLQNTSSASESVGSRRFAAVRALHNRMERVHSSVSSFRWMQLEKPLVPRRRSTTNSVSSQIHAEMDNSTPRATIQLVNLPMGLNPTSAG